MRIILIQPPCAIFKSEPKSCHPPLGLAYLYSALKVNHEVSVLDAIAEGYGDERYDSCGFMTYGLSFEAIRNRIARYNPDVVGVSWLFSNQSRNVREICRIAKGIDKRIVTIVGGAHPSAAPLEALKDANIDYAIIGEAEHSLMSLLREIEKGVKTLSTGGLAYRKNGDVALNPKTDYIKELDKIAFPGWDAFPLERYFKINKPHGGKARNAPFFPVVTSRGCPFGCVFCSIHNLWGKDFRKRSPENVLLEIGRLRSDFGVKEIMFEDDNLTLERERSVNIFRGIKEKALGLAWSVPNGIAMQTLDKELLSLMKDSGCYRLSFAVESGDEYVLKKIIKKPLELDNARYLVRESKRLGLETSVFFVIGFPGEKKEHLKNTFDFARKLGADSVNFFFATPLPGTELREICEKRGLIPPDIDYKYLKSNRPSFATEEFSKAELQAMVSREKLALYFLYMIFNPVKFLAKLLRKIKEHAALFLKI